MSALNVRTATATALRPSNARRRERLPYTVHSGAGVAWSAAVQGVTPWCRLLVGTAAGVRSFGIFTAL
jgi:hypothetical protein